MSTNAQANNSYAQKAKRGKVQRKSKVSAKELKQAAIETGKDLAVGTVGGGLAGAVLGKGSLVGGILVSFLGHIKQSRLLSAFGIGMMASSGFIKPNTEQTVNGTSTEGAGEAIKTRLTQFGENLKQRLWIDKLLNKKSSDQPELGEVKYFSPENGEEVGQIDLSPLDRVEQAIENSASNYESQMSGEIPDELDEGRIY